MAGTKEDWLWDRRTFGGIKRYLALPCAVPPRIYAEAFTAAIMKAIWSYDSPDPRHIYHKAFGRSALCSAKGVVNAGSPGLSEDHAAGKRVMFEFLTVVDLLAWYAFVGGIIKEGLIDWADGIVKVGPCTNQDDKKGSGFAPFGASFSSGRWGTFDYNFNNPAAPAGPAGFVLAPGEGCVIAVSATGQDLGGVQVALDTRIYNSTRNILLDSDTGEKIFEQGIAVGYRPSHTWTNYYNNQLSHGDEVVEWQSTCGDALPDDEVFPRTGSCFIAKYRL